MTRGVADGRILRSGGGPGRRRAGVGRALAGGRAARGQRAGEGGGEREARER